MLPSALGIALPPLFAALLCGWLLLTLALRLSCLLSLLLRGATSLLGGFSLGFLFLCFLATSLAAFLAAPATPLSVGNAGDTC